MTKQRIMSTENQVEDVTEEMELAEQKLKFEKEEAIRKDREKELNNKIEIKDEKEEIEEIYSPEELENVGLSFFSPLLTLTN